MLKHLITITCLFVSILILPFGFIWAEEAKTVELSALINEALKSNPQILSAYNNWIAQEYKIKQAASLPDPTASFSYFGESVETKVGPQETKYGFSQKIPFPGKLKLKSQTESKHAQMLKQKYNDLERQIVREVKFVYYDIFWVDKAIQINEGEKSILESLEKVVQKKYEANLTPQQDVIKVQVELSKLIDRLFLLRQNRRSLVAKTNSLLDRPKGKKLARTSVEAREFGYELEKLHEIAQSSSQQLQIASLDIERTEYEKSLAKLDYFPDFTFGFDYIQVGDGTTTLANDGQDAWMGRVMVNVPIWFGKLRAKLNEKERKLEAKKYSYKDTENAIIFEVEDLYFKITTYKNIISLYETALLPQTEQSFQAAKTAYETGRVDFLNWLDSEKTLLQTRLAYYKTIVDYQKSIAYLERVVGQDL